MQSYYSHPQVTEGLKFPCRNGAHLQSPAGRERSGHLCLTREAFAAPGAPSGHRAIFYSFFSCIFSYNSHRRSSRATPYTAQLSSPRGIRRRASLRAALSRPTPPEAGRIPRPAGSAGRAGGSPPFCPRAPSGSEQRPEGRSERSASRRPRRASLSSPGARPVPAPPRPAPPHRTHSPADRLRQGGRYRVSAAEPRHAPAPRSPLSPPLRRLFSLSRTAPAAGCGLWREGSGPRERRGSAAGAHGRAVSAQPRAGFTPGDVGGHGEGQNADNRPPSPERRHTASQSGRGCCCCCRLLGSAAWVWPKARGTTMCPSSNILRNHAELGACRAVTLGHF